MPKHLKPASSVRYTVEAYDEEAEQIARGELPKGIQNAMIGIMLLRGMTPEQYHRYRTEWRKADQDRRAREAA